VLLVNESETHRKLEGNASSYEGKPASPGPKAREGKGGFSEEGDGVVKGKPFSGKEALEKRY